MVPQVRQPGTQQGENTVTPNQRIRLGHHGTARVEIGWGHLEDQHGNIVSRSAYIQLHYTDSEDGIIMPLQPYDSAAIARDLICAAREIGGLHRSAMEAALRHTI